MSGKKQMSSEVQEVWEKLNTRWKGEDATAFYREYIVKISEIVDIFDDSCSELSNVSSECIKELNLIEQALMNQ